MILGGVQGSVNAIGDPGLNPKGVSLPTTLLSVRSQLDVDTHVI